MPRTLTFTDFSFSSSVLVGSPPLLSANEISVTPVYATEDGLLLNFASAGFHVGPGQEVQYVIAYTIDPPPPEILRFRSSMVPDPPPPPGVASVLTLLCLHASFSGSSCPSGTMFALGLYANGPYNKLEETTAPFPPDCCDILGVRDVVTLDGGLTEPASFLSFENTTLTDIPEPGSALLNLAGLAGLGLLMLRTFTKFR